MATAFQANAFASLDTVGDLFFFWQTGQFSLGGITSSFPALINSSADLHVKLADNSAFAQLKAQGITTNETTFMHRTSAALANGAAAATGTLTNAPAAGNPTKWIPINDNGTTRYIPAW